MPIKPEFVESVIKDIATHIRAADPMRMEITFARRIKPLVRHNEPSNAFTVGDELTITIEIK